MASVCSGISGISWAKADNTPVHPDCRRIGLELLKDAYSKAGTVLSREDLLWIAGKTEADVHRESSSQDDYWGRLDRRVAQIDGSRSGMTSVMKFKFEEIKDGFFICLQSFYVAIVLALDGDPGKEEAEALRKFKRLVLGVVVFLAKGSNAPLPPRFDMNKLLGLRTEVQQMVKALELKVKQKILVLDDAAIKKHVPLKLLDMKTGGLLGEKRSHQEKVQQPLSFNTAQSGKSSQSLEPQSKRHCSGLSTVSTEHSRPESVASPVAQVRDTTSGSHVTRRWKVEAPSTENSSVKREELQCQDPCLSDVCSSQSGTDSASHFCVGKADQTMCRRSTKGGAKLEGGYGVTQIKEEGCDESTGLHDYAVCVAVPETLTQQGWSL